jgi:GH24 family phage-related lysozyme (muramidase)
MKMTNEGLALIKRFEGLRLDAYRDVGGIWTIGYGHTGMAGEPAVKSQMKITEEEAHAMLARDVDKFAAGVRDSVTADISDAQFSALVSFAYNVGLGAFQRSSVLTAVNARDFEAVPRRLNLWAKAGGRVLAGLVRRRAAEGALFMSQSKSVVTRPVTQIPAKPFSQSRTIWSAFVVMLFAVLQAWLSVSLKLSGIAVLLVMAAGLSLIVYERYKKMKQEGV